jgi:hypothetical protein
MRSRSHGEAAACEGYAAERKRMIAPGRVRDHDLGLRGQLPNRRLKQSALAQRQQSRPVAGPRPAAYDRGAGHVASTGIRRASPHTTCTRSSKPLRAP